MAISLYLPAYFSDSGPAPFFFGKSWNCLHSSSTFLMAFPLGSFVFDCSRSVLILFLFLVPGLIGWPFPILISCRAADLIKWSGRVELYPICLSQAWWMMTCSPDFSKFTSHSCNTRKVSSIVTTASCWKWFANDASVWNHQPLTSMKFVLCEAYLNTIHWLAQECFVSLQLLWLCEGSDNKLKMW